MSHACEDIMFMATVGLKLLFNKKVRLQMWVIYFIVRRVGILTIRGVATRKAAAS